MPMALKVHPLTVLQALGNFLLRPDLSETSAVDNLTNYQEFVDRFEKEIVTIQQHPILVHSESSLT